MQFNSFNFLCELKNQEKNIKFFNAILKDTFYKINYRFKMMFTLLIIV
jgi:hypothetical protein